MVRNRNAGCLCCASACTSGCIRLENSTLIIQPDRCIGCGTCATVCPTCALEAHHPNDAQLTSASMHAAQKTSGRTCIACAKALDGQCSTYNPQAVVRTECLGRVEESLLTRLAAEGVAQVTLVHSACETCEHAAGWHTLKTVLETENRLLDAWSASLDVRTTHMLPSYVFAAHESRKESAPWSAASAPHGKGARESSAPSCAPSYAKVMADGTLPHFVPDRRERLLDALASLGDPNDVVLDTRLWGRAVIDMDICQSCRMCATFCPTGAIAKFDDSEDVLGIEHYPGDCVKCRTCESICPAQALHIEDAVRAVDLVRGTVERYQMKPVAVKRGSAHTIWHMAEALMNTNCVYER